MKKSKKSTLRTPVYTLVNGDVRYVTGTDAYDVAKALVIDAKDRLRDGDSIVLEVHSFLDEDEGLYFFAGSAAISS